MLRRRHRARRRDGAHRRVRARGPAAVALHRRAAVHPVALGADDRALRDPLRDAHRPARRGRGAGRVGADDGRHPLGRRLRDRLLRQVASRGGGRALADRPRFRGVVRPSALVRREPVGREPLVPARPRPAVVHARGHARRGRPAARRRAAHARPPPRRRRRVHAARARVPAEERRRGAAVLPLLQPLAAARPHDPARRVPGRDRQRRLGRLPRRAGRRLRRPARRARGARRRRRHDRRARGRQRRREPADRAGQLGRLRGLVLHVVRGRAAHALPDPVARQGRPGAGVERDRPPDRHVHDAARVGRMPDPGRPRDRRRRPARVLRGLTGRVEPRGLPRLGRRRAPRRQVAALQGRLRATAVPRRGAARC